MTATNHGSSTTRDNQSGSIYVDADNVWGNGLESDGQTAAVDAFFNLTCTWDYYRNKFGRLGLANNNAAVHSYVHYGTNYANAFYSGGNLYFGDGDANSTPLVSTDIVAHEFTHGVTEAAAGLVYSNESGASNESFSDIFGTAVEFLVNINPDYLIGEDITYGGVRSMADPTIFGHPDHYSELVYIGSGYDNGGVHFNSGVQNKAFYLLAEGGTHPNNGITVTGIGRDAAERIFYRALEVYVTSNNQFINVRNATVSAASVLYGAGSAQYLATERAWEAVGVGTSGGAFKTAWCRPGTSKVGTQSPLSTAFTWGSPQINTITVRIAHGVQATRISRALGPGRSRVRDGEFKRASRPAGAVAARASSRPPSLLLSPALSP